MDFFGIGFLEVAFILVIALLVLGPTKMVDTARTLGRYVRQLQKATSEVPRLFSIDEEPPRPASPPRQELPEKPPGEQRDTTPGP